MEENYIEFMYKDTVFENGYGSVSREIMRSDKLSRDAKAIYAYLMSFAGNKMSAFPSYKTVCNELKFKSCDTYYKYLNELKEMGILYIEQQKSDKGKFGKNIFHIAFKNEDILKYKALNQAEKTKKKPIPKNYETVEPIPKNSISDNSISEKQEHNSNRSFNSNSINKEVEEIHNSIFNSYYKARGKIVSEAEKEILISLLSKYSKDLLLKAINIAVLKSKNVNLGYIITTLEDWHSKGLTTLQQVETYLQTENKANKQTKGKRSKAKGQRVIPVDDFASYTGQREYDYDDLEKKLLGWEV